MKKYICFILFSLFSVIVFGQQGYEHRLATAIDIGTYNEPFTYTDSQYTGDFTDDIYWDVEYPPSISRKDVFYRITLNRSLDIRLSVVRSDGAMSSVMLLDDTGKRLEYSSVISSNSSTADFGLIPEEYYIVVEGLTSNSSDSMIDVKIEGVPRKTGEDFYCPFELGNFNASFNIMPSAKNIKTFRVDYQRPSRLTDYEDIHDVVFRFTLDCPMKVSLEQNQDYNNFIFSQSSLLNAARDTLCVSKDTDNNSQQVELSAGEYYIYGRSKYGWAVDGSFSFSLSGAAKPLGYDLSYPVEIGSRTSDFTYTDTRNTGSNASSKQPEKAGKEMHYRMTLAEPMRIGINTCGSSVADTYLKVFSADKKLMFFNDNYSGEGACSNTQSACLKIPSLTPGSYYIVTDASSNGNLTTTVTGTVITNPGDTPEIAIDLGTHNRGFTFSDIRDTSSEYTSRYSGKPTCDVYYRFTLEQALDVTIDHEGSSLANTSLALLNASQALVKSSGNSSGHASLDFKQLPAGTYYAVSEGISLNGRIKTNINIWGPHGDMSTTIGQPHIITLTPTVQADDMSALRQTELIQEIQYFNHLGLPAEKIQRGITPSRNDLVTLQEYDGINRETKQWLPAPATDAAGAYIHPYDVQQSIKGSELYGNDSNPYSQTLYDGSRPGRIKKQFGAGKEWQSAKKSVSTDYLTNVTNETALNAKSYSCTETALACAGDYAYGSLAGVKTTDEDGNVSYEFKDKVGKVMLSRQMDGPECMDTYYVYDKCENLRFVLPPLPADILTGSNASWSEDNATLKKYAYIYKYDAKNRCIYKKLPGCEPIYTVYDKADRAIFTQDGLQRDKSEWTFNIPDAFGRTVVSGTCKNTLDYAVNTLDTIAVKAMLSKVASATKGYTVSGVTLNTPVTLTANYYDNYDFIGQNSVPSGTATAYETVDSYGKRYTGGCRGQQTGVLTARLSKTGAVTGYLYSVMYYDERGRMVQQKGSNELNGTTHIYNAYNFTGKPTQVKQIRTVPGKDTVTELRKHTYDHAGRLLCTTYQLNNDSPVTLVDNVYDEAGRLKTERRSGNTNLKTDYAYNVRSWTKSISGPLFNQTLYYQEKMEGNTPCYNGNISSMLWKAGQAGNESGYRFTYDGISRMKDAIYGETNTLSVNQNRFNEQITGYDKTGNILGLLRYGQTSVSNYGLIDNLNLAYDGNQLKAVTDNAVSAAYNNGFEFKDGANQTIEYLYDKNGNLTKDLNKNITEIQYNCLNLPRLVTFAGGNRIEYEYAADGRKLRTVHVTGGTTLTTDYCGNAVYENGVLKMLLNEAGYASVPDKKFHFYLKDHQGNVRVVADQNGNVEEANHYYPFGGLMANSSASVQPYKYNGKELDRKNGLNWYDYGARHYDAALGRWVTVDPLAEKLYTWNPYIYCLDSPIKMVDPTGKYGETVWDVFSLVTGVKSLADNIGEGNVGAAIVDGVGVLLDAVAVALPVIPGGAGAAIKGVRAVDKVADVVSEGAKVEKVAESSKLGKYSSLPDPKNMGEGKSFTRSQKKTILEENRRNNGGELKSDISGKSLDSPTQSTKGVKANMNQAEVDHMYPKSKGGTNSSSNAQVISKEENLKKLNKIQ